MNDLSDLKAIGITAAIIAGVIVAGCLITFGILAFYAVSVFIHEAGHLFAARCVGWKPLSLSQGAEVMRPHFRLFGINFSFGKSSYSGGYAVAYTASPRLYRLKDMIFVAGGPIATALFALLLYFAMIRLRDWEWEWGGHVSGIFRIFVWAEACILLNNLWPRMLTRGGVEFPNDGLRLSRTFRMKPAEIPAQLVGHAQLAARNDFEHGRFDEGRAILQQAFERSALTENAAYSAALACLYYLLDSDRLEEAQSEYRRLADPNLFKRGQPWTQWDELACIPLFHGYRVLIPAALELTRQAIQEMPGEITLQGTYGSLLIESGEVEAGMQILEKVKTETQCDNDRAISGYYLALGLFRQGELAKARTALKTVTSEFPDSVVAPRISQEITANHRIGASRPNS